MSRADIDAFLDRVDDVTRPTCGACTAELDPDGASFYFCDDYCSDQWHATQAEPLAGYVDPWHRSWEFPGVGRDDATWSATSDEGQVEPPHRRHVPEPRDQVLEEDRAPITGLDDSRIGEATRTWITLMTSAATPRMSPEPVRYARVSGHTTTWRGAQPDIVIFDEAHEWTPRQTLRISTREDFQRNVTIYTVRDESGFTAQIPIDNVAARQMGTAEMHDYVQRVFERYRDNRE